MSMLILRENTDLLAEIGQRIVGASVLRVTYRQTEHGGLNVPPSGSAHEVDLEVVLRLSAGVVSVAWERDDLVEGLAIGWEDLADLEGVASVPADNCEHWQKLVGRTITDVHASWQVSEIDCPESMWSVRLSFGPELHAVIALGELDRLGRPTYHPDSLLLLFDESVARSYRPPGAAASAWGEQSLLGT
ncbi:hypothetical protein KZZ52_26090 [Dactylosporangium sp. AC04546]|uniref:hypothetical protein n=1 Tax=Dactylosporangium sp. AC04546 TaxID=2862460 RepID=UPI001EDF034D|nr:hypothetical protein [Dactylosporangium sp. AC04546]WVK88742.1 hypothetical protein KZZ52_26090 [Dactylosporangium sp. AC04546]